MRLSRDEEVFLRHWMYDEVHYREGQGPAKRLQVQHQVVPVDLAVLIAASMPDPIDQEAAGLGPPPGEPPAWPWTGDALHQRLSDARATLGVGHVGEELLSEIGPTSAPTRTKPATTASGQS